LIDRASSGLSAHAGRKSEAESAQLLEGIAVVVYDPDTGTVHHDLPKPHSGLRWGKFYHGACHVIQGAIRGLTRLTVYCALKSKR
jgi:hypothetical protein